MFKGNSALRTLNIVFCMIYGILTILMIKFAESDVQVIKVSNGVFDINGIIYLLFGVMVLGSALYIKKRIIQKIQKSETTVQSGDFDE